MARAFAEIAFTPSVLTEQTRQGSADSYAKLLQPETNRGDRLTKSETSFIEARDGFYQSTVSETGWPYVQFRGGPAGFINVINEQTIAYADYRGNRQYISTGNLTSDDRVSLILMDYPNRRRLKIWGHAKLVDINDDPELIASLFTDGYRAKSERAVTITVGAFDWNCPQHIPQRLTIEELEPILAPLREQISQLTSENRALKSRIRDQN